MPLAPDPNQKGLWVNNDLKLGDPGVFALVIGVSRYDHLAKGRAPAQNTYGLGQLKVSARTAYRFFEWLRKGYALNGWPVARARLLLSPLRAGIADATEDELAGCDSEICDNAVEADFANCKSAIAYWYREMRDIPPSASGRSLFFFSGHGLELKQSQQVLLPSDYLSPPGEIYNDAISTRNLIDCLPYLSRVAAHVLLVDACRNEFEQLRGLKVAGTDILNENFVGATNAIYDKGILYATAPGLQAYQPQSKDGISLFGQALLDGLRSKPMPVSDEAPIELRCNGNVCRVEINGLTSYIKGRIDGLIKAANESVVQIVRSEVYSSNPGRPIELAEVRNARPALEVSLPNNELTVRFPGAESLEVLRPDSGPRSPRRKPRPVTTKQREAWLAQRYSVQKEAAPLPAGAGKDEHIDRLHDAFGSEAVTYPWFETLGVTGLSTRRSADHSAVKIVSTLQGEQTGGLHRVQIHFQITERDPVGHLLTIRDVRQRPFGCILPEDGAGKSRPIYQLEIDVGESEAGADSFIRFAAYLSGRSAGVPGKAAAIWDRLRALNPVAATGTRDSKAISDQVEEISRRNEEVLAEKVDSPLAATVAGLALLKANRFDLMHDWARNVGNWFNWIPDGVVIWTEQCRRMGAGKPLDPTLIPWFATKLATRSLPFTADGFGIAADLVRDVQRKRIETDEDTRRLIDGLAARIDAAIPYFRDDGLFCTFASWPDDFPLRDAIGPPRRAAEAQSSQSADASASPTPARKRKPSARKKSAAPKKPKAPARKKARQTRRRRP